MHDEPTIFTIGIYNVNFTYGTIESNVKCRRSNGLKEVNIHSDVGNFHNEQKNAILKVWVLLILSWNSELLVLLEQFELNIFQVSILSWPSSLVLFDVIFFIYSLKLASIASTCAKWVCLQNNLLSLDILFRHFSFIALFVFTLCKLFIRWFCTIVRISQANAFQLEFAHYFDYGESLLVHHFLPELLFI